MRALIIGDVHLSDRPPSLRKETYVQEILDKLRYCVEVAYKRECDVIVQAGDIFHIKAPSRTSHRLVQATHDVLTASDIPLVVVPGNHDLSNDRLDSLDSQPLGALGRMEGVTVLTGPHSELPIFGLPYLADWGEQLQHWIGNYRQWADRHRAADEDFFPLLVTHAPIFPEGEDPPYDYIGADDWCEMMEVGACYYGHIHDPHGIYLPGGHNTPVIMCNNGALSRGSLHEATLKRKPAVTIFDSSKRWEECFETVPVPHLPAEEVFNLDAKRAKDAEQVKMTAFLDSIGTERLEAHSLEQVTAHLDSLKIDPKTRELAKELVTWAATE